MRATRSLTASVTRLRADGPRRAGVPVRFRPSAFRRVLLVLGLAVGGWVVSALIAGATAAATTDQPSGSDDLGEAPVCTMPDTGELPQTRSDLDPCGPTSPGDTAPAEDGDAIATPDAGEPDVLPGTEAPDDEPAQPIHPDDPEEIPDPARPDEPTAPARPTTPGTPDDVRDAAPDSPRDVEPGESGRDSVERPTAPMPEGNPRPLLTAATDSLLSTTTKLTSTLAHTTDGLTGWLFGALPEVTSPITDTIDDVVDVPRTLPGTDAPLDLLPDLTPPRLPVDLGDLLPGTDPDRPLGEPRVEPVAPPVKSERPGPVSRQSSRTQSAPTGSAHHADPGSDSSEARGGDSSRPSGPAAPSPAAPASVAAPSHPTASPHDNNPHAHRGEHGVLGDVPTVTQLRLLGVSRDHDIVGLGREAALPTTSPD